MCIYFRKYRRMEILSKIGGTERLEERKNSLAQFSESSKTHKNRSKCNLCIPEIALCAGKECLERCKYSKEYKIELENRQCEVLMVVGYIVQIHQVD